MIKKEAIPDFVRLTSNLIKKGMKKPNPNPHALAMGEVLQFMGKYHVEDVLRGDFSVIEKYCDYILKIPDEEIWGAVEIE